MNSICRAAIGVLDHGGEESFSFRCRARLGKLLVPAKGSSRLSAIHLLAIAILVGLCTSLFAREGASQDQPPGLLPNQDQGEVGAPTNPLRAEIIPTPPPDSILSPTNGDPVGGDPLSGEPPSVINPTPRDHLIGGRSVLDQVHATGPLDSIRQRVRQREFIPPPPPGGRVWHINPMAIPQGVAGLVFGNVEPVSGKNLGFPFSLVPERVYGHIPRLKLDLSLPNGRSIGKGSPLATGSWQNRPYHVDVLSGGYFPGRVIEGLDAPEGTTLIGGRIGRSIGFYYGVEMRFATAEANLPEIQDVLKIRMTDVSWQYYPWGDSRVRPFTSVGFGITNYEYSDAFQIGHGATNFSMPIGIGIKYYANDWLTTRLDVQNNITFGTSEFRTASSFSVMGGIEFRFGGRRRTYFPFNSSRSFF